jgi:hypothetical protein
VAPTRGTDIWSPSKPTIQPPRKASNRRIVVWLKGATTASKEALTSKEPSLLHVGH